MTARCRHCGLPLEGTHTGPCPKCGKRGKIGIVVANETVTRTQNVEITKYSRREQIKRRPSIIIISTVLFLASSINGQIDYDLSSLISLILGALGFGPIPLKEKIVYESRDRYRN